MNKDKNIIETLEERMRWLRALAHRLLDKAGKVESEIVEARSELEQTPPPPAKDSKPES